MDELFQREIINSMTWSFSRINAFGGSEKEKGCPYEWKCNYIDCIPQEGNAYSDFGGFVHKCLELFFKGELNIFNIEDYYKEHYLDNVVHDFPKNKYKDLAVEAYESGLAYLQTVMDITDEYDIRGVEQKITTQIDGHDFIGFIDLLLKRKDNGEIECWDHKSTRLKILKNGNISKTDQWHWESFKRQQLLYSKWVKETYGKFPARLRWNMFRMNKILTYEFNESDYNAAVKWAADTIKEIEKETEFPPNPDNYYCSVLCGYRHSCPYRPISSEQKGDTSEIY